jgi:DNA-binding Xre family transcriptional regulator
MITFERLWETLKKREISQYKLIKEYKISTGQLDRLRKNGNVNTYTLNQLCKILNCKLEDIAEYIDDLKNKRKIIKQFT